MADQHVDSTDKKILDALYVDAYKSQKHISHSIGISEPNYSNRVTALKRDGVIKNFTVNIEYDKVGYGTHAVTLIKFSDQRKDNLQAVIESLLKVNIAIEIYEIFGQWDIYVRWLAKSNTDIRKMIDVIDSVTKGAHTETITLAQEHKWERGPLLNETGAEQR
jgi:DNA-binding Lrp family transcriptional regulator